jgi:CRISPR-associated endonuclease/helicase Cas3
VIDFDSWFSQLARLPSKPHDWQHSLAADSDPRSRLIRIPTGMGKTLGVLAAWSWNRLHLRDDAWPRRLVWCLPMRVLVEQTDAVVRGALGGLNILWDGAGDHTGKVGVHLLMGGADPGGDWNLFPEESAVLIGTQDMLLSRALNRGYAAGRARWPLEFGLLSYDAL